MKNFRTAFTAIFLATLIILSNFSAFAESDRTISLATENAEQAQELTEGSSKREEIKRRLDSNILEKFKGSFVAEEKDHDNAAAVTMNDMGEEDTHRKPEIGSAVFGKSRTYAPANNMAAVSRAAVSSSDYESVISPSFKNGINHPHLSGRDSSEYISPFDGTLQLSYTDLHLPGRNGLDLTLGRIYKSEMSNVETSNASGDYTVSPTTYYNKRYALGLGWAFSFPSVEVREKHDGSVQAFYHDGTGAAYRSNYNDSTKNEAGEDYYNGNLIYCSNLDNYFTDNVRFKERDRTYTRNGQRSEYSFKTADNTMQYFAVDGRLLAIQDRFHNEIKFDYTSLPGENLIPFYSYREYTIGSYWSYKSKVLTFDAGTSIKRTTETSTQIVDLNPNEDEYYVSLLYDATDDIVDTFEGKLQVYCDLYTDSTKVGSVLVAENTPSVYNETVTVEGEFSLSDYNFSDTPNRARLRLKIVSGLHSISFTDIRLSPKIPLISKITDTIGRTVLFHYKGDIYTRYTSTDADYPIDVLVKDPDGKEINSLKYYRNRYSHSEEDYSGSLLEEHRYFFFWGCDNGIYSNWVDYDYFDGDGSSCYANRTNDERTYSFYGRAIVNKKEDRNSTIVFSYEKVTKWTDNRSRGSSASATTSNTGFIDTWRVASRYTVDDSNSDTENAPYNQYSYNYSSGYFDDETGYDRRSRTPEGPGYLNPSRGVYTVIVTNPNGSKETYNYNTHTYDEGFRRKWKISLPLLDKKIFAASSAASADSITEEYTYEDSYAIISPTKVKTTEKINDTSRIYYTKTEYDSSSCMPLVVSLPLTETEASQSSIPTTKRIKTSYRTLDNRLFLPVKTEYYQKDSADSLLTETYNRDSLGRVTSIVDAAGNSVSYEYDTTYPWLPSRMYFSDPENTGDTDRLAEVLYEYGDDYGFGATKERVRYSTGKYAVNTYEYEPQYGNIVKYTDPNSNITSYSYDWAGRVKNIWYPSYTAESGTQWLCDTYYYYNYQTCQNTYAHAAEKITRRTNSSTATYGTTVCEDKSYYDDLGNLLYRQSETGKEEYHYDNARRPVSYQNQADFGTANNTLTYSYDGFDRVTAVTDRLGNQQKAVYKSLSNEYSFIPSGGSAENHYVESFDMYGRKISEKIYPNGFSAAALTTSYEYDLAGNLLKRTDANGKVTRMEYDRLNHPVTVTAADNSQVVTEYTKWNTAKNTSRSEDGQPYTIAQSFDDRGLAVSHRQTGVDIATRPWYYSYREDGKLAQAVDPNGSIRSYSYDGQGNNTNYSAGAVSDSMCYNHFGQLDQISRKVNGAAAGNINYTYDDKKGWLLSKNADGRITSYTYNTLGSVTGVTSPDGLARAYDRDALERLTQVTADGQQFAYEYYGDGLIKKITYPGGALTTEYTYDNANRVKTMVTKKGTATLKSYSYTYDKVGNILSVSGSESAAYTYDALYRLKTATVGGVKTTYNYDARDNLISESRTGYSKTYEYGGDNRLQRVNENGKITEYAYDLNGNMIRRGDDEFAYDVNDKLIYAKVDGVETTYEIGLDGLRKSKTTGGVTTRYDLDDSGNVIAEGESEIILGHRPLAKKIGGSYYYFVYNAHGDVVAVTDENGNIQNSYSYDAWGNPTAANETIANSHQYAGEYYDTETGLIYLRSRYYDPQLKRFIQEDPARDELNWYAYCGNNPVMFVDPLGLAYRYLTELVDEATFEDIKLTWNSRSGIAAVTGTGVTLHYVVRRGEVYLNNEWAGYIENDKIKVDDMDFARAIDAAEGVKDESWMILAGTVGGAVAIKAGGSLVPSLSTAGPVVAQISSQTQQHIMQEKHLWGKVVSNPNNWQQISSVIKNVIENGYESSYGSALKKTLEIGNHTITVTYKIVDGMIRVSNAWVNK